MQLVWLRPVTFHPCPEQMNKLNQKGREGHDRGLEGHSLGLGGVDVCVGYILSSISASPLSVLTKPVAGRQAVVKKKNWSFAHGLIRGSARKKENREKREKGQEKINLRGSKVNQAEKTFRQALVSNMASPNRVSQTQ